VLKNLSARLTERFGEDWSYDTLVRCRKFYVSYLNAQIVATPLLQLDANKNKRRKREKFKECENVLKVRFSGDGPVMILFQTAH
jgi:hypothetical protein